MFLSKENLQKVTKQSWNLTWAYNENDELIPDNFPTAAQLNSQEYVDIYSDTKDKDKAKGSMIPHTIDEPTYSVQITSVTSWQFTEGETNLLYHDISQQNIERVYAVMSQVLRPGNRFRASIYKTDNLHAIRTGYTGQSRLDTLSDCVDTRKRPRMTQDIHDILSALHERLLQMELRDLGK